MNLKSKIGAILSLLITSITVLVMLTTSFELLNAKYLPSFMLAQKYALPLIVSAMAVAFLTFFEPERLQQPKTVRIMRITQVVTFLIFSFYLTTVNMKVTSDWTMSVYVIQWIALLLQSIFFFTIKTTKAAL